MRILYNSTNHDVVCTDQDVEYTNHDVVYIFHGDNLEIDEIVIIFVYSKKNVFYLKIRTIVLITIVGIMHIIVNTWVIAIIHSKA